MRRNLTTRRGVAAVLAMVYLVLFSTLALGFFATINSSSQLAANDQRTTEARLAAESGIHFIKYHLSDMRIPKTTPPAQIFEATYDQLSARLDGTPNMKGKTVDVSADGTKIYVPGPADAYIPVDGSGTEFRVTIEKDGDSGLRVTAVGRANASGSVTSEVRGGRGVRLEFDNHPIESPVFAYGVAAAGPVTMDGESAVNGVGDLNLGNMLIASTSTPTLTMRSKAKISGNVAFGSEGATYDLQTSDNTIGGVNEDSPQFASKISTLPEPPEFPAVDTDAYKVFAGNPAYGGMTITPPNSAGETQISDGTRRNILIKASPHPDRWVKLAGNMNIDGVVYIETPNKVRIDGNVVIRGIIVVQNNPTGDYNRNQLHFDSNVDLQPMSSLVGVNSTYFPTAMTDLGGASILAPKFTLKMLSNFGTTGETIVADKIVLDSNAAGTINGSMITLADTPLSMNSNAKVQIKSRVNNTSMFRFSSNYKPNAGSYREVRP